MSDGGFRPVKVEIDGAAYRMRTDYEQDEQVRRIVRFLNERIEHYRNRQRDVHLSRERLYLLVALNLAALYLEEHDRRKVLEQTLDELNHRLAQMVEEP